jgi:hypothetical protein
MTCPLPYGAELAVRALVEALNLQAPCVQLTINFCDDGLVQSVEPRLKFKRNGNKGRDNAPPSSA